MAKEPLRATEMPSPLDRHGVTGKIQRNTSISTPTGGVYGFAAISMEIVNLNASQASEIFKALGDENRLRIVELVAQSGEICACDLLDEFDITQPTLSHHMKILKSCGLVNSRKDGRWHHYSINVEVLSDIEGFLQGIGHEISNRATRSVR